MKQRLISLVAALVLVAGAALAQETSYSLTNFHGPFVAGTPVNAIQYLGPYFELPKVTAGTAGYVQWTKGRIYPDGATAGGVQIAASAANGAALGASLSSCNYPTFTSCDIVYSGSTGTVAVTTDIGVALDTGNVVLAYIETNSSSVPTKITYPYQMANSRSLGMVYTPVTVGATEGISPSFKAIYGNIVIPSTVTQGTQYYKSVQGLSTTNTGAHPAETWGGYFINDVNGTGVQNAAWGVVGETAVDGTGNFGVAQDNSFNAPAGYFHSWINATKTLLGGIDAPLIGDIDSATGRRKADAAVVASLNGAISQSTAGAGAAFLVRDWNTSANFDYGLDMYYSSGSYADTFNTADIRLSSGARIITGSADPNGSVSAVDGSIYLRTGTATASTVLYVCTGTTTWAAVTVP